MRLDKNVRSGTLPTANEKPETALKCNLNLLFYQSRLEFCEENYVLKNDGEQETEESKTNKSN